MISNSEFRKTALSYPGVHEAPHFERTSFRVKNKIFATLHEQERIATFKFSEADQMAFCQSGEKIVYPVPNAWGKQGWTHMNLKLAPKELLKDAMNASYQTVLKKK